MYNNMNVFGGSPWKILPYDNYHVGTQYTNGRGHVLLQWGFAFQFVIETLVEFIYILYTLHEYLIFLSMCIFRLYAF